MLNTDKSFYGQQTDERILYVARPHSLAHFLLFCKFLIGAGVVFVVTIIIGQQAFLEKYASGIALGGGLLAGATAAVGAWIVEHGKQRNVCYITDRRVVKFEASTPFATNTRSLNWEEAVKVKTFAPNALWKQLKIGTVVVHARTTIASPEFSEGKQIVTDDDVEIPSVYYYRDLGNYIEKILFLYKKQPKDIATLKPFVTKEKGKRD